MAATLSQRIVPVFHFVQVTQIFQPVRYRFDTDIVPAPAPAPSAATASPLRRDSSGFHLLYLGVVLFIIFYMMRMMSDLESNARRVKASAVLIIPLAMKRSRSFQRPRRRRRRRSTTNRMSCDYAVKRNTVDCHNTFSGLVESPRMFIELPTHDIEERDEYRITSPHLDDFDLKEELPSPDFDSACSSPRVSKTEEPPRGNSPGHVAPDTDLQDFGVTDVGELRLGAVDPSSSKCGAHNVVRENGEIIGVFKPFDEGFGDDAIGTESPHRSGVFVGDCSCREIGAYLLDHDHFSGVPLTRSATLPVWVDGEEVQKYGSIQKYVENKSSSEDWGDAMFSIDTVHRIGVLDIRIFNMDRHGGNLLVTSGPVGSNKLSLVPIDHGLCLPDWRSLQEATFEWLDWEQANAPLSEEIKSYVRELSLEEDARILKDIGVAKEAVFTNTLCTEFLKRGVDAGLSLHQIGTMVSRDICCINRPSVLEMIIDEICPFQSTFEVSDDMNSDEMSSFLESFRNVVDRVLKGAVVY